MKNVVKKVATIVLLCTSLLPYSSSVFAATDQEGIKADETVVNGGVDLVTPLDTNVLKISERAPRPAQVILRIPFQTQINNYYCGPAAATMVVNALGYNKTQQQMAALLGTTTNGTNAGNGVANALNSVVRGSKYQFRWEWHTYNQVDKMKGHVVEALSYGNPVMVNTAESPGDVFLKGHNIGVPLYHFGVIGDYFNHGNEVTYTDPGYGRIRGFVQDQRVSITNMSYAAGTRGYAW
ncbi:C39 family peptidase [Streptococcus merionis]|uniref:C39 family peptidase n=1 Tax=Streptococcus merionis TaxID=400065 RepID=UPI003516CA83